MKSNRGLKITTFLLLIFVLNACKSMPFSRTERVEEAQHAMELLHKANRFWQHQHKPEQSAFWDWAAYHTGNMAAFRLTGNNDYLLYSTRWAAHNHWMGARSTDVSKWKYKTYGEGPEFVLFGDWQICFQTYIQLNELDPDPKKVARALEVMSHQIQTDSVDYWWWSDALYMVMPLMTQMYDLTGDVRYLDKLQAYYEAAVALMYDEETGLFFRDAKYIYPKHKSSNGYKDFWSRGNGWVFAAYARVLERLPKSHPSYALFVKHYVRMAEALSEAQQQEGHWTRSLLDPAHAPGFETSGTAFFAYGYFWGMKNGFLSNRRYAPIALKSWKYLSEVALSDDGRLGYVQPIGERAIPGQRVNEHSQANFGVGAFLLAASAYCEWVTP